MATRYRIAEQVLMLLNGGTNNPGSSYKLPAVMAFVNDALNKVLKVEFYTTHIAEERTVNGMVTAFYEGVTVEEYNGVSRCTLPASPIKLLKDQGIFQINKPGCMHDPFIPIPSGRAAFLRSDPYTSDVLGHITYEHISNFAVFNKNLPKFGVTKVDMQLVVFEMNSFKDHEPLPIPGDMVHDVVRATYELLTGQRPPDKHVDSNASYKPATA